MAVGRTHSGTVKACCRMMSCATPRGTLPPRVRDETEEMSFRAAMSAPTSNRVAVWSSDTPSTLARTTSPMTIAHSNRGNIGTHTPTTVVP